MKNKFVKQIPNMITILRLIAAITLIFLEPVTIPFFVVYLIGGITDALDGFLARKLNAESKLGNVLDSIGDLTFYTVLAVKFFPVLLERLELFNWFIIIVPTFLHICAYIVCAIKFHKLSALHTYGNKFLSILVFFFPFSFIGFVPIAYNLYMYIGGVFALYSGLETLLIHLISKRYDTRNKTIFVVRKNERNLEENHN